MINNEKKYFVVNNEFLAKGIAFASKERYYVFSTDEGKKAFSFNRTKEVEKAYYLLCNMRFGDEKFPMPKMA